MPGRSQKTNRKRPILLWLVVGSIFMSAGLAAGGCNHLNLRGEPFAHDETFRWSGNIRPADSSIECVGFSNKARQIEQDFGAR
jgi:hypothetical protein